MGNKVIVVSSLSKDSEPVVIYTTVEEVQAEFTVANAQMVGERDGNGVTPMTRNRYVSAASILSQIDKVNRE